MKNTIRIFINIALLILVVGFTVYMVTSVNKSEQTISEPLIVEDTITEMPYEKTGSFNVPGEINRFELHDNNFYIITSNGVYIYDNEGNQISGFQVKEEARDIAVRGSNIFILYPTLIEVYSADGELNRYWEACSELSDYWAFTLAGDYVFVTDAENKHISQYTIEGNFVKFINSPINFIIPSYSFDIASLNDTIYCVNSGRHLIEKYTLDGEFIASFGGPGGAEGYFSGCCNPVYITFSPEGDLLTSEKGNPRISSFSRSGEFNQILLNSRAMGGGNTAYQTISTADKLFVASGNAISVFLKKSGENNIE